MLDAHMKLKLDQYQKPPTIAFEVHDIFNLLEKILRIPADPTLLVFVLPLTAYICGNQNMWI